MRKHTLYLLLAGWGLLAASCYDDKSTLQTTHIPPVEIEVPEAIASQLTVVHNARLDITGIRITKDGRENPEELTYEWTVSQTDNDSEAISLATTREFHEVIDLPISSKGYLFLLTVTDTAHDLKYQYKWTLIVTAQFNEGLVVAYTRDGTTSDLGLIMHPQLTETYSGAEQGTVEKELISRRNGSPFPSAVTHMLYTYDKTDKKNILWVSTDDDLMRVETDYYEILGHKEDAFVYLPGKLDIRSLLNTYQCTMILNDGDIYETLLSRGRISTPVSGTETMTVDNGVVSAHSAPGRTRKPSTIFYDREQGKFCYGYNQTFYACGSVGSSPFDPGNAPGLRCIAGGISIDNATHTLLMRKADGNHALYTFGNYSASAGAPAAKLIYEICIAGGISIDNATHTLLMRKADGNHALYTFGNYSASAGAPAAKLIYEIPAEANALIAEAVSFVFSRFDPILYIATRSAIYKVIFTTGSVNFDPAPVFTAPAGEHITLARLYLQGYYAMENYDGSSTLPSNASLAWSSRAVTVVTSKDDGNDKIHVVPQINFGSGQLDQPNALVFDGFGKILDFTVAGLYK